MIKDEQNTFQLEFILPETPMPERTVISIDVPASDGRLTVMANHQSLIAALKPGTMKIVDSSGQTETCTITAGALQVEKNKATVLVREFTKIT